MYIFVQRIAYLGFSTKEKRDEHVDLLNGKNLENKMQLSYYVSSHTTDTLTPLIEHYKKFPNAASFRKLNVFGPSRLQENTIDLVRHLIGNKTVSVRLNNLILTTTVSLPWVEL